MDRVLVTAGQRALGKRYRSKKTNSENPFKEVVIVRKHGREKEEKQERAIFKDERLSKKNRKVLKEVCEKAYRWDQQFKCCCFGVQFGWSAILGLIPIIGDALEVLLSLSLVRKASKVDCGLPTRLYLHMIFNIMLDFGIGFIPVLGDLGDVAFRANTRNAWLLNNHLVKEYRLEEEEKKPNRSKVGDVEQGVEPMQMVQAVPAVPATAPPARLPAPKPSIPPPGRNLTGRQVHDPRD